MSLRYCLRLGLGLGRRLDRIFAATLRDRKEHMRGRPYLYLQVLGVARAQQGRGLGGRLLRALIERSEGEHLPLYLETEDERNVRLYEKFGFQTLKVLRLPLLGLPSWEMARTPSAPR